MEWAVKELAGLQLPDQRLIKRAQLIVSQFSRQPTASIPQACEELSQAKAAYRFFDNEEVAPEALIEAHTRSTVQRMQGREVVPALQDTTHLNYSTHPETEGLGPISNNADKTIGLMLHATLAVSPEEEALGLLSARTWVRDSRLFGSNRKAHRRSPKPTKR